MYSVDGGGGGCNDGGRVSVVFKVVWLWWRGRRRWSRTTEKIA